MKILIFIIAFIVAYYFAKYEITEQEVDQVITDIDNIEKSENIDDSIKNTEAYNKEAIREFNQMKAMAKSPASIKFMELTEKQNSLASEGEMLVKEMQPLINSLTPEMFDDPEKLSAVLTPLCGTMNKYIPIFSEIIQIVKIKSDLLNENPIISTELFAGEHEKMKELIAHLHSSQSRIFEDEKRAYADFKCENYVTEL